MNPPGATRESWTAFKEALKALAVEDVARSLDIPKKGARYFCPSCQQGKGKTPDLQAKGERFYCFKCGAHGDGIGLVELALSCDFKAACLWLADKFGVRAPDRDGAAVSRPAIARPRVSPGDVLGPKIRPAIETPADVSAVYEDLLSRCPLTPAPLAYAKGRGWSPELLARFDVAAIPADSSRLLEDLAEKHGVEVLLRAGVADYPKKKDAKGERTGDPDTSRPVYLRFFKSLLFPFYSRRSFRVEFLQARALDAGATPKYMSAGRPIPCLWNEIALAGLEGGSRVYVAEGIPDALTLAGAGFNAVACLGVQNLREDMIRELAAFDVTLAGNRDASGEKFNREGRDRFARYGRRVKWALPPEGSKDWNEYLTRKEDRW